MEFIPREVDRLRFERMRQLFSVVAILGPRQCGKTTFARQSNADHYFDLENPRDISRLLNPQLALEGLTGIIVIDEIQRQAELFPLLRYLVDSIPMQKYLILGSASRDLIKQSSESLAGRIGYYNLSGFRPDDVQDLFRLWVRGGYPRAYTATSDTDAFLWIENFIATFLERDIPQLGIQIPSSTLRRFWTMLSHYHGQILNYSELSRSFGISDMTARKYVEILEGTFMIRLLKPWYVNSSKRIVKASKLFMCDSGIFHSFQGINSLDSLQSNPKLGASFEGFAIEIACKSIGISTESFYFYRTHNGAELDLFWQYAGKNWGIEIKYSDAPTRSRSMTVAIDDLSLAYLWVIYPGKEEWKLDDRISVRSIFNIKGDWDYT